VPSRPRRQNGRGSAPELPVGGYARLDRDRVQRVGVPEIVLGEGKTVEHLLGILRALQEDGRGALVSRPTRAQRAALVRLGRAGPAVRILAGGRLARLPGPLGGRPAAGPVAILAAGTSDVPIAEEARAVLLELGIRVVHAYDVGVAGLHRLLRALRRIERARPRIYLVFAGREGALPTVVAGLVGVPVVGVPTSVGYGRGGRGEAALAAMLQSCAPIAVVNIDAAVPAALFAAQGLSAGRPPRRSARVVRRRGRRRAAARGTPRTGRRRPFER
jgi:pyridinium-3,5-biscarboxylic acid mononucleotide synthase